MRLDQLLVARGLLPSRSRARDAILRGTVSVDGIVVKKPGVSVSSDALIDLRDAASKYVSRAALKLAHGLDHFGLDPEGKLCLDIGASTGGFTQVLLERGARHVIAIDVGHGQLHADIAGDACVTSHENLNARDLTAELFDDEQLEFVVSDVSFISLKLALPAALGLAAPGAQGLFLVKPQFEVGKANIGKNGLVRDPAMAEDAALELFRWLDNQQGWSAIGIIPSPIEGGDGNREYLLAGQKDGQ